MTEEVNLTEICERMKERAQYDGESIFVLMAEKMERYESALRFYANIDNYDNVKIGDAYLSPVQMEEGERARVALYGREEDE